MRISAVYQQNIAAGVKAYQRALITLLLLAFFLMVLQQFTPIDFVLADYYYDNNLHRFIWKDHTFATLWMHDYVKHFIMAIGLICIAVVLLDLVKSIKAIKPWLRIRLRFIAFAAIVIPSLISIFKHHSVMHCPWDIDRYGGVAPYLRLFDALPTGVAPGHCFPAGHASTGLWLAAISVFWLPHQPRIARGVLMAGLSIGLLLGWVQQMRGAHFLSHTLWSAWIACAVLLVMLIVAYPRFAFQRN